MRALSLFPVLALAAPAAADVLVVDDDAPADHATIQAAVDAAHDGDVILVRPGVYPGFVVDDRALTVAGQDGAEVQGPVRVQQLSAQRDVVLSNLQVQVPAGEEGDVALWITQCSGSVRVQDCWLVGAGSWWDEYSYYGHAPGDHGVRVSQSADVFLVRCHAEGGDGGNWDSGTAGLVLSDSRVAAYDCELVGGAGLSNPWKLGGWAGGHGCWPQGGGRLMAVNTSFVGGDGGHGMDSYSCIDPPATCGGDGGHGLVAGLSDVDVLDCSFAGGDGGEAGFDGCGGGCTDDGDPGEPIHVAGGAPLVTHPGPSRWLQAPLSAGAGVSTPLVVRGQPGDLVELGWHWETEWNFKPALHGVWMPTVPPFKLIPLGTVPPSGVLEAAVDLVLPPSKPLSIYAQIRVTDTGGQKQLGSPAVVLLAPFPLVRYCVAAPNSVGSGAPIDFSGGVSLSANDFVLTASAAPAKQFGFFFYGAQAQQLPLANGYLCVGGQLFRFKPPVQSSAAGTFARPVDFTLPPAAQGAGWITAGSTWNFQLWYRDPAGGGAGSNFTDAIAVTFWP